MTETTKTTPPAEDARPLTPEQLRERADECRALAAKHHGRASVLYAQAAADYDIAAEQREQVEMLSADDRTT